MGLLGLIGEALQALEDLAYIGATYLNPHEGPAPRFLAATIYSPYTPTTFYQELKKRADDELLDLLGLRVLAGKRYLSLADVTGLVTQLAPKDLEAIRHAEAATVRLVREHCSHSRQARPWGTRSARSSAWKRPQEQ